MERGQVVLRVVKLPNDWFMLPFEEGTWILSLATLNKYTEFRRLRYHKPLVYSNWVDYRNEVLTIAVSLERKGEEEMVYLKVGRTHLMVSSSTITTSSYLSVYAYMALHQLMDNNDCINVEKYYWPDFFNPTTGKSKYLNIINDRKGLDVEVKPGYGVFYKPGLALPPTEERLMLAQATAPVNWDNKPSGAYHCAYFVFVWQRHVQDNNLLPIPIPYMAKLNKAATAVKAYVGVVGEAEFETKALTAQQKEINSLLSQLELTAKIAYQMPTAANPSSLAVGQRFALWHRVWPLLCGQHLVKGYALGIYGNLAHKPSRSSVYRIDAKPQQPQLVCRWRKKAGFYQLSLLLKIANTEQEPCAAVPAFFVAAKVAPRAFYLLPSLQDLHLYRWFSTYGFTINVLDAHVAEISPLLAYLEKYYKLKVNKR